jgi:Protein of unknown function (DUF2939)
MRFVKKLLALAVVALVVVAALVVWQSPWWALREIDQGLRDRDVIRVERYADLEELVKASAQLVGALAAEQAGVGGSDLGSRVLRGLAGAVAERVGEAAAPEGARELRRAVQEGRVTRALGPFTVHDGFSALGPIHVTGDRAVVDVKGHCGGTDARLGLVFREQDGATFGWPKKWVLIGIDPESVKELAKVCRAG